MGIKKHIPNALTCCNLLFGCLAVIEIFNGELTHVIYFTVLSGLADFLDGFAARLLHVQSAIGKDLDSLADLVSFGLVPSLVMFRLIEANTTTEYLPYVALSIAIFSALRLAKFNNDSRQSDSFIGVPTPASALFFCPLPMAMKLEYLSWLQNPYSLAILAVLMSLLMISELKLIALKFKGYGWRGNEPRYLIIVLSIAAFATFQWVALPFIILLYLLTSIFTNLLISNN